MLTLPNLFLQNFKIFFFRNFIWHFSKFVLYNSERSEKGATLNAQLASRNRLSSTIGLLILTTKFSCVQILGHTPNYS